MTNLEFLEEFQKRTTKGNSKLIPQSAELLKTELWEIQKENKGTAIELATKVRMVQDTDILDMMISVCLFVKSEYSTYKEFNENEMTFDKYMSLVFDKIE